MAEVAATETTTRKTTRKAATRKTAARKPAARKAAARKAAPKRTRKAAVVPAISLEKVQDTMKEVAYVQLGIAGKVYDEFNARVGKARKDAPKQWDALVKRGEKVQRDLEKAGKELRSDLQERVESLDAKAKIEQRIEKVRKVVTKLGQRVRKAA